MNTRVPSTVASQHFAAMRMAVEGLDPSSSDAEKQSAEIDANQSRPVAAITTPPSRQGQGRRGPIGFVPPPRRDWMGRSAKDLA